MTLADWHHRWVWLAITACGGSAPTWTQKPAPGPTVSVFDAPPLAGARYLAQVSPGDFGNPGPLLALERGSHKCGARLATVNGRGVDQLDANAAASCDADTVAALAKMGGFLFLADDRGQRWYSGPELVQAAAPIDTPAKAALVAWANGFALAWYDGKQDHGDLEHAIVRTVDGGFEVAAGATRNVNHCGGPHAGERVINERLTLFVDRAGAIVERERVEAYAYEVSDPCHPMGRRPSDFADRAAGATLAGYLLRMQHHEAESVRAFERIARELAAHGAPRELIEAAARAACDERDHAERCARLTGGSLAIATDALPVRSLVELAIDNAREGCAGEAYAALVAVVQARSAGTTALREHFTAIARDEIAHAALASAIAAWLDGVLAPGEREEVSAARDAAIAELAIHASALPVLGFPRADHSAQLLAAVRSLASLA